MDLERVLLFIQSIVTSYLHIVITSNEIIDYLLNNFVPNAVIQYTAVS